MRDPSWNTYTPTASSRFSGWMKGLAGLAVVIALLITALVTYQQSAQRLAWPLARSVAARLATDEGARDLYAKNPELQDLYPTQQAFLDTVRPLRAGLTLPDQEPRRNRRGFITFVGPSQARVRARGEGGTWMDLTVRRRSAFGPEPRGEGLSRLLLANSREGLLAQFHSLHETELEPHWQRFRDTAATLATEAGAHGLLERPGLSHSPSNAAAFLALRQRRQAGLAQLPPTRVEAHVRTTLRSSPFGREVQMACPIPGGGTLSLTWKNDQLTVLELD